MRIAETRGAMIRILAMLAIEVFNPLFVISIALFVSVGYVLTLTMPVNIATWTVLLWVCTLMPLALLLLRAYHLRRQIPAKPTFSMRHVLLPLIPLLILVPTFLVELISADLQILYHGDFHVGYIWQLFYGATPVESIFLPGYPANYYWLYHAYLAALVNITSLAPPLVSSIINMLAILSAMLWIALTLIELKLARAGTICLGLVAVLVYCSVNMTGVLTLISHVIDGTYVPDSLRIMLLDGAEQRLHSVLGKVMNFTSMGLGITFFCAALYSCVKLVQGKLSLFNLIVISACGIAGLAIREIATLYIVAGLFLGLVATALVLGVNERHISESVSCAWDQVKKAIQPSLLALWLALSLALSLPLLKYLAEGSVADQAGDLIVLFEFSNISMIVAALLLPLPLFLVHAITSRRRRQAGELFIAYSCMSALVCTLTLSFPEQDHYKGVFFLGILMTISALFPLRSMQTGNRRFLRNLGHAALAAMIVLTFARIGYVGVYYYRLAGSYGFHYESMHIQYSGGSSRKGNTDAYYWVRKHSPHHAIVVKPLTSFKFSNIIHERQEYVKPAQNWYTEGIPAYDQRVQRISQIYDDGTNLEEYRSLLEAMETELPGRPIYAVVKDSEVGPGVMAVRGAQLVYKHDKVGGNVYFLNPWFVR